jgi:hypothetical protein
MLSVGGTEQGDVEPGWSSESSRSRIFPGGVIHMRPLSFIFIVFLVVVLILIVPTAVGTQIVECRTIATPVDFVAKVDLPRVVR